MHTWLTLWLRIRLLTLLVTNYCACRRDADLNASLLTPPQLLCPPETERNAACVDLRSCNEGDELERIQNEVAPATSLRRFAVVVFDGAIRANPRSTFTGFPILALPLYTAHLLGHWILLTLVTNWKQAAIALVPCYVLDRRHCAVMQRLRFAYAFGSFLA